MSDIYPFVANVALSSKLTTPIRESGSKAKISSKSKCAKRMQLSQAAADNEVDVSRISDMSMVVVGHGVGAGVGHKPHISGHKSLTTSFTAHSDTLYAAH